jgi:hypothetical protein
MNSHPRHPLLLLPPRLAHSVLPRLEKSRQNSPRSYTPNRLELPNKPSRQLSKIMTLLFHTKHYSHSPKVLSDSFSLLTPTPQRLFRSSTSEEHLPPGSKPPFPRVSKLRMDSVMRSLLRLGSWERMMIKPLGRLGGLYCSFFPILFFLTLLTIGQRIDIYEISCIVYD